MKREGGRDGRGREGGEGRRGVGRGGREGGRDGWERKGEKKEIQAKTVQDVACCTVQQATSLHYVK